MSEDTETLIREIYAKVREIDTKLESDYRALYGNGHPGLIADVANLKQEIAVIKSNQSWWGKSVAGWVTVIAFAVNAAISIIALFLKVK